MKAVWAIDPFDRHSRPTAAEQAGLARWCEATGGKLVPVHVAASPGGLQADAYAKAVEAEMVAWIDGILHPHVLSPVVLMHSARSLGAKASLLVSYAEKEGAAWIMAASRGESGWRRLAVGSFTEELLKQSTVPLWACASGPSSEVGPAPGRILFATDFSASASRAYGFVLEEARKLNASVVLYHRLDLPHGVVEGVGIMGAPAAVLSEQMLFDRREDAEVLAQSWLNLARKAGVPVELAISHQSSDIAASIAETASRTGAGVVALASQSGPYRAFFLGSVARAVLRGSDRTVWAFGPSWLALSALR